MTFSNRVAVVTGGAGRVGRPLCEKFADAGVAVAVVDIDAEGAEAEAEKIRQAGGNARGYAMDIQSTESVRAAAGAILADFGRCDILVNNAGVWRRKLIEEMDEDLWLFHMNLNLNGVFRVTKAFLPGMLERRYGRIVNVGSIAGEVGLPFFGAYATAKAGVKVFTETLAMEVAKRGVTVNSVSPGMIADAPDGPTKMTWVERCGTGAEVADVILFLAADEAAFITGADYAVDGGRTLGPRFADV